MASYERHVFICEHERPESDDRGCCSGKGSREILSAFKGALHARRLHRAIRANPAGCLGQCAKGVTCVVYPDGVWYGGLKLADVEEIIEKHLVGNEVVEHLRIPEVELMGVRRE